MKCTRTTGQRSKSFWNKWSTALLAAQAGWACTMRLVVITLAFQGPAGVLTFVFMKR
jgi:hypothetical protein